MSETLKPEELFRLGRAGITYPWSPRQSLRLLDELREARLKLWRLQGWMRQRGIEAPE